MIHLDRLPEPDILQKKKDEWTKKFIESKKRRPDNSKYAHSEIKSTLEAISSNKCFYCERKLSGLKSEVDHYIEVAEKKELAFDWDNLFLACDLCNGKFSNKKIPCKETLNPFFDSDEEITKHIYFIDEQIVAKGDSKKGELTIQKYKLNSERHDYLRLKMLQQFSGFLERIRQKQISGGGRKLNESEIEVLKQFSNKSSAYSSMFKQYLKSII